MLCCTTDGATAVRRRRTDARCVGHAGRYRSLTAMPDDIASRASPARSRRDPTRPLLTWYDDATGERTELSGATLANWVAKTANLLVDGLGLGPGDRAARVRCRRTGRPPACCSAAGRPASTVVDGDRRRRTWSFAAGRPGRPAGRTGTRRAAAASRCSLRPGRPAGLRRLRAGRAGTATTSRRYGRPATGVRGRRTPPRWSDGATGRRAGHRAGRPGAGRRGRAPGSAVDWLRRARSPPAPASCSAATSTRSKLADRVGRRAGHVALAARQPRSRASSSNAVSDSGLASAPLAAAVSTGVPVRIRLTGTSSFLPRQRARHRRAPGGSSSGTCRGDSAVRSSRGDLGRAARRRARAPSAEHDEQQQLAGAALGVLQVHDQRVGDLGQALDHGVELGGAQPDAAAVEGRVGAAGDHAACRARRS